MDLKLKFKIVALATKYKNQIDFGYINNAIKEYCSYNSHVKTISNIGMLDIKLGNLKASLINMVGRDNVIDMLKSFEFYENVLQPFCKLLGINYSVVIHLFEKYFESMKQFMKESTDMGCDVSYALACCSLYLNYISIPSKYMKEYFDYVKQETI